MRDPRNARLAQVIVEHSLRLEPRRGGPDRGLRRRPTSLVLDLVERVQGEGGIPVVRLRSNAVQRPC